MIVTDELEEDMNESNENDIALSEQAKVIFNLIVKI